MKRNVPLPARSDQGYLPLSSGDARHTIVLLLITSLCVLEAAGCAYRNLWPTTHVASTTIPVARAEDVQVLGPVQADACRINRILWVLAPIPLAWPPAFRTGTPAWADLLAQMRAEEPRMAGLFNVRMTPRWELLWVGYWIGYIRWSSCLHVEADAVAIREAAR